jgi:hypothetical protein
MTDQVQRTAWALDQFEGFVAEWTPPATLPHLIDNDDNPAEMVRRAIRAIAPPAPGTRLVGYAVFGQKPDRERESGFEHIAISAVFDDLAQAQNAYDFAQSKGEVAGCKYFVICAVQQIPT